MCKWYSHGKRTHTFGNVRQQTTRFIDRRPGHRSLAAVEAQHCTVVLTVNRTPLSALYALLPAVPPALPLPASHRLLV